MKEPLRIGLARFIKREQGTQSLLDFAQSKRINYSNLYRIKDGESEFMSDTLDEILAKCHRRLSDIYPEEYARPEPGQPQPKTSHIYQDPWPTSGTDLPPPRIAFLILLRSIWAEFGAVYRRIKVNPSRIKVFPPWIKANP